MREVIAQQFSPRPSSIFKLPYIIHYNTVRYLSVRGSLSPVLFLDSYLRQSSRAVRYCLAFLEAFLSPSWCLRVSTDQLSESPAACAFPPLFTLPPFPFDDYGLPYSVECSIQADTHKRGRECQNTQLPRPVLVF